MPTKHPFRNLQLRLMRYLAGGGAQSSKLDRQRGVALLLAIVVAVLLSLIGLSLTRSSMTEFNMSNEFEAHEKALIIADAAFNMAKDDLRGQDLTTLLSTPTNVPKYLEYQASPEGSPGRRNPIHPYQARNIDFDHPPYAIGSDTQYGFMTPGEGALMGTGRYFARIADNQDEAPLGLSDNPRVDQDYQVFLRVLAVHRGSVSEVNTVGTSGKNSLAILEGILRRDLSFDLASPLVVYGPNVNAAFNGNSYDLVGDANHPAVTVLNNDPASGDASAAYQSMLNALSGSRGRVVGQSGPDGVSLEDGTQEIRDSGNPDATNVFDPAFLVRFASFLAAFADNVYTQDTHLSGGTVLGTPDNPEVTVALGDLTLTGGGRGAGILVVRGSFELGGAFDYDGLVLVVGEGDMWLHGANKNLTGGVYVARVEDDGQGNRTFGVPSIRISGNSNFVFDSDDLKMAINILPMKVISLREVTPDMEP